MNQQKTQPNSESVSEITRQVSDDKRKGAHEEVNYDEGKIE